MAQLKVGALLNQTDFTATRVPGGPEAGRALAFRRPSVTLRRVRLIPVGRRRGPFHGPIRGYLEPLLHNRKQRPTEHRSRRHTLTAHTRDRRIRLLMCLPPPCAARPTALRRPLPVRTYVCRVAPLSVRDSACCRVSAQVRRVRAARRYAQRERVTRHMRARARKS